MIPTIPTLMPVAEVLVPLEGYVCADILGLFLETQSGSHF